MFRSLRSSFVAALVILSAPSFAAAQGTRGVITGVVKDSSGGVLPGHLGQGRQ